MPKKNGSRDELPLINCHTHIFTGDYVPPFLARTFLPWPFYFLIPVHFVIWIFRKWFNQIFSWRYKYWYRKLKRSVYDVKMYSSRKNLLAFLRFSIGFLITIQVCFIVFDWLSAIQAPDATAGSLILRIKESPPIHWILFIPPSTFGKLIMVFILFIFFKPGRNIVWFLIRKIWSFFGLIPGPASRELAKRYITLGRFSFYTQLNTVFLKLRNQYDEGTGFVILPMDMEYMGAGKVKNRFRYDMQMKGLAEIKQNPRYRDIFLPFVSADPRRIDAVGSKQLAYKVNGRKIELQDCIIRTYIEEHKFSGFKIYPALGYYPFDITLLPLLKYAADRGIPIIAHCSKGPIYYRGKKRKEWDHHPVFEQPGRNGDYNPLILTEVKNRDYTVNFTHPLNYLCLLEEKLLRKVIARTTDENIHHLFGFKGPNISLKSDLSHLKICFGHFGGDDEWNRFFEKDRDNFSSQLIKHPTVGIRFLTDIRKREKPGKIQQIWRSADWYSIICSLMLQYENVYADISYILIKPEIYPLLKQTLRNPVLRNRILYGTDFYVVRNHKSDKHILAEIRHQLSEAEFDQIARFNPRVFLENKIHGKLTI